MSTANTNGGFTMKPVSKYATEKLEASDDADTSVKSATETTNANPKLVSLNDVVTVVTGNVEKLIFENSEIEAVDFIDPFEDKRKYPENDIGMGYLFAETFRNRLRYIKDAKSWFYYDGCIWKEDTGSVFTRQCAKILTKHLFAKCPDDECSDGKFVKELSKRSKRETIIKEAQDVYSLSLSDFDTDPFLLNCLNGTFNLQTGQLNQHNPTDFLRKKVNARYDPQAKCERWDTFINQIMCGEQKLAVYLQKCLGYGLSGDVSEECLFILYGPTTRNGKGTLMESTYHMLGDYAKTIQPDTLAHRKANGSGHSDDIAQLAGIRFVNASELPKDMKLNSALVKQITGGDTVMARRIYQGFFEYRPQYAIYINTNYLPPIEDGTLFSSGRIILLPFNRHFNADEQDPGLKKLFREDNSRSAILNWMLEGYRLYIADANRLKPPKRVEELLREYRLNNDPVGLYIEKRLVPCNTSNNESRTRTSDFHKDFLKWCEKSGISDISLKEFVRAIREKGLLERDRKIGHYLKNYRISEGE